MNFLIWIRVFLQKFWFYLSLFWSNLTSVISFLSTLFDYFEFRRMLEVWRCSLISTVTIKDFYWCWLNCSFVLLNLIHLDDFILIYIVDFDEFHGFLRLAVWAFSCQTEGVCCIYCLLSLVCYVCFTLRFFTPTSWVLYLEILHNTTEYEIPAMQHYCYNQNCQ